MEQKEAKSLREALKSQTDRVEELEDEVKKLSKALTEQLALCKEKEEEALEYKVENERFMKELEYFKKESSRNEEAYKQIVQQRDQLLQQFNDYVAREEFVKELNSRQQGAQDDKSKQLAESEYTVKTLEEKLEKQDQQLNELISELGKEQESKREEVEKLQENETKIKVSFF